MVYGSDFALHAIASYWAILIIVARSNTFYISVPVGTRLGTRARSVLESAP